MTTSIYIYTSKLSEPQGYRCFQYILYIYISFKHTPMYD